MNTLHALVWISAAMVGLAALEAAIPLRARGASGRAHLVPNLALTGITFAVNALLNLALVVALAWAQSAQLGVIPALGLPAVGSALLAVIGFDLAWYATHVSMHHSALLWRFHRVHHSDLAVDVTTAIRQHPGETLVRYAYYAAFGVALGASPAAFAIYRFWSALHGLFEHANLRLPLALDTALSWVVASPNMHKIHHSRAPHETNSNYGNILALFDRAFRTFTPARRGVAVDYGLDGFDDPALQTTAGLLALPFRDRPEWRDSLALPKFVGREEAKADPAMAAVDQLNRSSSSSRVIAGASDGLRSPSARCAKLAAAPSAASASARLRS